jgi:hypothetical protein
MKSRSLWAVGLVFVALLSFGNWGGKAQTPQRKTWEYKVVVEQYGATPPTLSEQRMNQLGAEGWELVDTRVVTVQQAGGAQYRTDYHFKRVR